MHAWTHACAARRPFAVVIGSDQISRRCADETAALTTAGG
jgi:hypothetical protein